MNKKIFINGAGAGLFWGFLIGAVVSTYVNDSYYQEKAIEGGAAIRNATTGKFEWVK